MDDEKLKEEITLDEGRGTKPYKDTMGIWSGGIGHNLEAHNTTWSEISQWLIDGIPDRVIDQWYDDDVHDAEQVARGIFGDLDVLPDPCARALVNLAFDLMWDLRHWPHLIEAVKERDWTAAQASLRDSRFAQELSARTARLCQRFEEGKDAV